MSTIQRVIVAGASGNLGPIIVKSLVNAGFTVSILARTSSKSTPPSTNIKVIYTDYSEDSLIHALQDQDAVVSTIGAPGTLAQIKLIDAAIAAKVKCFIPSDFAFDSPRLGAMEPTLPELYKRLKPKAMVLKHLAEKSATNPGFSWTAIGSGPLFDWTLRIGLLGISLPTRSALITDSGNEPYPTSTLAQLGRAVTAVLQKPDETANKYLFVASWTTTQNEVLRACETATKSKWKVSRTTSQQRLQEGNELLARGDFKGIGNLWNVWCHSDGKGHALPEGEMANGLLGLPAENLVEVVAGMV